MNSEYVDYETALDKCKLDTLFNRRQAHMTRFAVKCTKDKFNSKMFPLNDNERGSDKFKVNFARTSQYLKSTIPQSQRLLNKKYKA